MLCGGQDLRKGLLPPPALPEHPGHWLTVGLPQAGLAGPLLVWQIFSNICSQPNQEPETMRYGTQAGQHGAGSWGTGFAREMTCEPHKDTLKDRNGDLRVHDVGSLMGKARTLKGGPTGLPGQHCSQGDPPSGDLGPSCLLPAFAAPCKGGRAQPG